MFKFLTNLFDENKKTIDRHQKIADHINSLEPEMKKLTDKQLASQTAKFKNQIDDNRNIGIDDEETLTQLLPEVFATVREVSRRVIGLRHYDVQLLAGVALHYRAITEQRTGEGKTLTVTAPLYLNALLGHGSHLVTVNDYLAELGCGWMGPVYTFLGMSTSVIVHDSSKMYNANVDSEERGDERLEHFATINRQQAYAADITYGTNNEFGFDYLRDNMVQDLTKMVQQVNDTHQYAIVDEADSILIDEARTPLIISAPDSEPTQKYYQYARMITTLEKTSDYTLDEKARSVTLTDLGIKRVEQKLGVKNLYEESYDTIHHIEAALKAKTLYIRDKEYIVRENEVIIVDEHTGRLMYGRRYSDGLHQAIEAKEGVPIQQESRTLATVSLQNYFRMYHKLAGMTGTALTEAEEFRKIYNTDVLVVPTHRPIARRDRSDVVYKTTAAKYSAIANEVEIIHSTGQPILIGTRSINHNEIISDFLKRKKIPHNVLNAKNNEKEAFIIADAGKKGAITVATNIAGRGVDIVLGGSQPELKDYRKKTITSEPPTKKERLDAESQYGVSLPPAINPTNYKLKEYAKALAKWKVEHQVVIDAGGLFVLGTERHESRRIDNQLRGRSGRQGDPGASQFFVALEDDIMRIFGGEQIKKMMDFLKIDENQPIEHGMIGKSIESAQVKVEGFFFDQRKRLVEFDDVMNKQREVIYHRRRRLLEEQSSDTESEDFDDVAEGKQTLKNKIMEYIREEIKALVTIAAPVEYTDNEFHSIVKEFAKIIPFDQNSQDQLFKTISSAASTDEIIEKLETVARQTYEAREKAIGIDQIRKLELLVSLSTIDEKWMDHLDAVESLREGIWLRGDKNTVLAEYKKEAFTMFSALIGSIESAIATKIFRAQLNTPSQFRVIPTQMIAKKDDINEDLSKEVADATPLKKSAPTSKNGNTGDLAAALGGLNKRQATAAPMKSNAGVSKAKIGRNDVCPCGSGLKYKKCGLINAPQHRG